MLSIGSFLNSVYGFLRNNHNVAACLCSLRSAVPLNPPYQRGVGGLWGQGVVLRKPLRYAQ
jgi:hypothetical protein